jgi:hypothetical protein
MALGETQAVPPEDMRQALMEIQAVIERPAELDAAIASHRGRERSSLRQRRCLWRAG